MNVSQVSESFDVHEKCSVMVRISAVLEEFVKNDRRRAQRVLKYLSFVTVTLYEKLL